MSANLQGVSDIFNGFSVAEQFWHDWLNLEAFAPEPDISLSYVDHSRQEHDTSCFLFDTGFMSSGAIDVTSSFNVYDISPFAQSELWTSSPADIASIDHIPTFSPPSSSSSLFSPSPPPPLEASPMVQFAHHFDISPSSKQGSPATNPFHLPLLQTCPQIPHERHGQEGSRRSSPSLFATSSDVRPHGKSPQFRYQRRRNATQHHELRRSLRVRSVSSYRDVTPYSCRSSDEDNIDHDYGSDSNANSCLPSRDASPSSSSLTTGGRAKRVKDATSVLATTCNRCKSRFSRHADLVRHCESVHLVKTDEEILSDKSTKRLFCLGCTKILSRKDARERHEGVCPAFAKLNSPDSQ